KTAGRLTRDVSDDLLAPEAQRLRAQLGVFAGGCTLASAEAVCEGFGLDALEALVDESLVRQRETPAGEARFSMLELVREYALERLESRGEGDAARPRHLHTYDALPEQPPPER